MTLLKGKKLTVHVRFKGGMTQTIEMPRPQPAWELRRTPKAVVKQIYSLAENHTDGEVASKLNEMGLTSGEGKTFNRLMVHRIRNNHGLKSRHDRLRETGMLTLREIADRLDVTPGTVKLWRRHGLLRASCYNDKNQFLYEHPGDHPPTKMQGRKLAERRPSAQVSSNRTEEVQCGT